MGSAFKDFEKLTDFLTSGAIFITLLKYESQHTACIAIYISALATE